MTAGKQLIELLITQYGGRLLGDGRLSPYHLTAYLISKSFVILAEDLKRKSWDIFIPAAIGIKSNDTIVALRARIEAENLTS